MRWVVGTPIRSDWCPYRQRRLGRTDARDAVHTGRTRWGHSEKVRREASEETRTASQVGWASRTVRNEFLWLEPRGLWCFVSEALISECAYARQSRVKLCCSTFECHPVWSEDEWNVARVSKGVNMWAQTYLIRRLIIVPGSTSHMSSSAQLCCMERIVHVCKLTLGWWLKFMP